jgi:hypothetical protein
MGNGLAVNQGSWLISNVFLVPGMSSLQCCGNLYAKFVPFSSELFNLLVFKALRKIRIEFVA